MAKKDKEQQPKLNFDGKEYIIEDMAEEQRVIAAKVLKAQDHVRNIQDKLRNNMFMNEQFVENEKTFLGKLEKGTAELRESLNPKIEEAELVEA